MADKAHFATLFDYHWHTTRHLLECAAKLDAADYTADSGYSHGSIHRTFTHVLLVDRGFRLALETGKQPAPLSFDEYPDLAALQRGYSDEQADWQTLLRAGTTTTSQATSRSRAGAVAVRHSSCGACCST